MKTAIALIQHVGSALKQKSVLLTLAFLKKYK